MRKQTALPPGKGARGGGVPGSSASLRPWGQADDCQGPSFPAQGRRGGFQRQVLSEAHPGPQEVCLGHRHCPTLLHEVPEWLRSSGHSSAEPCYHGHLSVAVSNGSVRSSSSPATFRLSSNISKRQVRLVGVPCLLPRLSSGIGQYLRRARRLLNVQIE